MNDYKRIMYTLIDKSFPLLKNRKIFVLVTWFRFYAFSAWIPPFLRVIVLSKRVRHLKESEITGLIAHELCHQERYIQMGVMRYLGFVIRFLASRDERTAEEKATDRLTIQKGYGRELYELSMKSQRDSKHKRINKYYLSPDEIRSFSESLGKW